MTVAEAIKTMRAIRQFTDQPVPEEDIRAILNAGRRAQSSKNTQPWQFVVVRDRATLARLAACGPYAGHLAGAAFGVALVSAQPTGFDLGQATAYMQLAAWERGIGFCIATMYEKEQARAVLGIPDDQYFDNALSFGYPAPEAVQAPPPKGGRQPLDEIVHWERW
jgi:nitroreductase